MCMNYIFLVVGLLLWLDVGLIGKISFFLEIQVTLPATRMKRTHTNETRGPWFLAGWVVFFWHHTVIPCSYIGMISYTKDHKDDKDPYQPTRIQWKMVYRWFFRGSPTNKKPMLMKDFLPFFAWDFFADLWSTMPQQPQCSEMDLQHFQPFVFLFFSS